MHSGVALVDTRLGASVLVGLGLGLGATFLACTPGISAATGGSGGATAASVTASGTASTATGQGGGGCMPVCTNKQCGPDACNGTCGMCASTSQTCSADGLCCSPTWSVTFPGNGQNLFASPDGTTIVGTHGGDVFRVGCDGQPGPTVNVASAGTTFVGENAQRDIIGTGDALQEPLHVYFDVASGKAPSIVPLPTFGAGEGMWLGDTIGSDIWTIGSIGMPSKPFLWKTNPASPAATCTSDMGLSADHYARGIVADGNGGAFVSVESSPNSIVHVTCSPDCQCSSDLVTNAFPAAMTIRGLARSGTNLFAVGFDTTTGGIFRIDAPSGQLLASYSYDPTSLSDGFNAVATDGANVYVGGGRGIDFSDMTLSTGYSVLGILPVTFVNGATPALFSLTKTDFIWSLRASSLGVVVSGQKSPGTGFAARCTLDGACPSDLL